MTTEDLVRRALREEAAALVPPPWPAAAVRAAARARVQRRRARTAALAVAVAVAVPVAGVLAAGTGADKAAPAVVPSVPASSKAAPHPPSPPPSAPAGRVRTVTANQNVWIGHGQWLRLTPAESCEGGDGDPAQCGATTGGNQKPGSVSLRASGDSTGTFFLPLYLGPGQAARMTVTVAGRTYQATVLTLPGHPGYATGYAWVPGVTGQRAVSAPESITVYGPDGTRLAELDTG